MVSRGLNKIHIPMAMAINVLFALTIGVRGKMVYIKFCFDGKHIYNTIADKCISPKAVERMSNILRANNVDPELDNIYYQECMCGPYSSCGGPITCGPACTAANCCEVFSRHRSPSKKEKECYEKCSLYKEAVFSQADIHTCFPITTTTGIAKKGTCGDIGIAAISFCPNGMTFDMNSAKRECAGAVCDNRLVADVNTCCLQPNPGCAEIVGGKCSKCKEGFYINAAHMCAVKICTCKNGIAAVGTGCTTNGREQCFACSQGFTLNSLSMCSPGDIVVAHGRKLRNGDVMAA